MMIAIPHIIKAVIVGHGQLLGNCWAIVTQQAGQLD